MFTGIVETATAICAIDSGSLTLKRPSQFDDIAIGHSIAVAGVCLTVTQMNEEELRFDVVGETWNKTNLGQKKVQDRINVERSVPVQGRFEGHVVQGHVEGTAEVVGMEKDGIWTRLTARIPQHLLPYIAPKGAIALDGVSLTVAQVEGDLCTVALIPHTMELTTLGTAVPGMHLNIETDVLARYCHTLLSSRLHAA